MIKLNTSFNLDLLILSAGFWCYMEMRWLFSTTGDINNETSRCWNFDPLQSFVQTCYLFFMVAFWKITKIEGHQYLPFLFSSLAHSKMYFPLNTPATNVEISTAIATIMTKSLRRNLGERLAAVNRYLLPLIESCSPRFASSRWIWFKEPEHGCRIYFTLKLRRTNFEPKWVALISVTCKHTWQPVKKASLWLVHFLKGTLYLN